MKKKALLIGACLLAGIFGMGIWRGVGHLIADHQLIHDNQVDIQRIVVFLNSQKR